MEPDDVVKAQLLDSTDLGRTLDRMARQVMEHIVPGTDPAETLGLVGMQSRGVYLAPSAFEAGFVSSAHQETHIEATVTAAREAFASL